MYKIIGSFLALILDPPMNLYYISWLFLLSCSDVEIASHFVNLKGAMDSTSIKGFVLILTSPAKGTSVETKSVNWHMFNYRERRMDALY